MRKMLFALLAAALALMPMIAAADAGEVNDYRTIGLGGGVLEYGTLTRSEATGAVDTDAWMRFRDKDGNARWERTIGGSRMDGCESVTATGDGGFLVLVSTFSNDRDMEGNEPTADRTCRYSAALFRLDAEGATVWRKFVQESPGYIAETLRLEDGCLLLGQRSDGGNVYYPTLLKIDGDGLTDFDRAYPEAGHAVASSATPLADGGFLLVGRSLSPIPGGNFYTSAGWAQRVDSRGNTLWARRFYKGAYDGLYAAAEGADGALYVCGALADSVGGLSREGGAQGWLARLTPEGGIVWETALGLPEGGVLETVEITGDGRILAKGYTLRGGGKAPWRVQFDKDGSPL